MDIDDVLISTITVMLSSLIALIRFRPRFGWGYVFRHWLMKSVVIGDLRTKTIVEISTKYPPWTQAQLDYSIPANYGGKPDDYSYYRLSRLEQRRYRKGNWTDRDPIWSGNRLVGIDFGMKITKLK